MQYGRRYGMPNLVLRNPSSGMCMLAKPKEAQGQFHPAELPLVRLAHAAFGARLRDHSCSRTSPGSVSVLCLLQVTAEGGGRRYHPEGPAKVAC